MSSTSGEASPQPRGRRIGLIALVFAAVLLAVAGWLWFKHHQEEAARAADQQRLEEALARGRKLSAELADIKPPNAPECPPGQSLKTFAPDATLSKTPSLNTPPAAGANDAPAMTGTAAVLPDYALAQRLENVTAMVLAIEGDSLSGGSGFFIAPNLLVTNRHVVEHQTGKILLVSKALGSVRRATLIQITQGSETGTPDFALLRMDDGTAPGVLDVSPQIGKLASVVAAGYPAVVVTGDPNFQKLLHGDSSAAPDLNLTQGAVQSLRPAPGGTPLIVHTASIAKGNSGGPLVDACGRLVGVNTFISVDQTQSSKINYALLSTSMSTFLTAAGATARIDSRSCGAHS